MTRAEKHERIVRLRQRGWSLQEAAANVGLSYSGARNILNDPDGSKQKARRERYRGTCVDCGAKTDGSSGFNAPPRCAHCTGVAAKVWTREAIIDAILRYASVHGHPPTADGWRAKSYDHTGIYPSSGNVYNHGEKKMAFDSWADAIEAAGFPRPYTGTRYAA